LETATAEVEAQSVEIDAKLAKLEASIADLDNMTIQDVADTYPEWAEEAEQDLVDGAYVFQNFI
jgi:nicotinate-nucleotide pyrophosphorylase